MTFPDDVGIVDLMLGIPGEDNSGWYDFMQPLFMDEESRRFRMPVEYMFKQIPRFEPGCDFVKLVVEEMDRHGIERAMIGFDESAVGTGRQLGDFTHHALLVLFRLGAGGIVLEHDVCSVIRVFLSPFPALHRGAHEADHLVGERRVLEAVLEHVNAILKSGDTFVLILEGDEVVRGEAGI